MRVCYILFIIEILLYIIMTYIYECDLVHKVYLVFNMSYNL